MTSAILQWLDNLGLAQYADRFEADDIDLDPSLHEHGTMVGGQFEKGLADMKSVVESTRKQ